MTNRATQLLIAVLNWFNSVNLRKDISEEQYQRGSILLVVAFLSALSTALILIGFYFSAYPEDQGQKNTALTIASLSLVFYLGSLIFYKTTRSIVGSANLYAAGAFISTALPGLITGGLMHSPNLQIIILVPVWAMLMAGRTHGIFWTVVLVLTLAAYYLAEKMGIVFPQAIPADVLASTKFIAWLTAILCVVICLLIFEINLSLLTERLDEEHRNLIYQADHDSLTGLLNRKAFQENIEFAIKKSTQHGTKAAVLYMDLDDFKPVNDTYGHTIGDEVLAIVASKLMSCIRSSDIAARIGGDEFAVVLHDVEQRDTVTTIANKVLESIEKKIVLHDQTIQISASIGIALIPENSSTSDGIIAMADQAMYNAKNQKSHICFCDPSAGI
jgi:diguanylate cyclase (GGDEF)-like protein